MHLSQVAQDAFEAKYGHEMWMKEFGKNYFEEEEKEEEENESTSDSGEHEPSGFHWIEMPNDSDLSEAI